MTEATHSQSAFRWDGTVCGAVVVLAILLGKPFVEVGLVDDFSYIKTAWVYAATGRFVYNGWATAMLGWQIPWGALFVRVFGYKVWPLHLSNLVLVALCIPVLHAVMVRSGLRRTQAAFATLFVGLSPIFIPLASSFMTDVGGLLAIMLCWYACLRALESEGDYAVWLWMLLGSAAGVIGGTSRQIAWIAALAMVPATGWLLRRRRGVPLLTVVLFLASLVSVVLSLRWFRHQLFSVPEPIIQGTVNLRTPRELAGTSLAGLLCLGMLCLPVLVATFPRTSQWKGRAIALGGAISAFVTVAAYFICFHLQQHGWMPWTGDIVERLGILDYDGSWLLGVEPMMFNRPGRAIASFVIVGLVVAALWLLRAAWRNADVETFGGVRSWRVQLWLLGPFVAGYLLLLLPRAIWFMVLDRYLLPLLPVVALLVLRLCQQKIGGGVGIAAWGTLLLFSAFAVMGTHDWLENHRARLQAIARLGADGIPVEHINAGYEINGMTQIQLGRAIVDGRVSYPPEEGIQQKATIPPDLPARCRYTINVHTPMVIPEYFLSYQAVPCLRPSRFGAVPIRSWLPPFDREIVILERDPAAR